jgi:hypothetical protein
MNETLLFAAEQHDVKIRAKIYFSFLLPFGATIPTRLRRYSGLAVCPYSFAPPALHPGLTCRVNYPG